QAAASASPQAAPRASALHPRGETLAAPGAADQATGGGAVRAPPPVRAASADQAPAGRAAGAFARRAPTQGPACHHGRSVSPVRPPLPHGYGAGQAGPVAAEGAALPQPGQEPGQVTFAQPGEGPDLPGRQVPA